MHSNNTNLITLNNFYDLIDYCIIEWIYYRKIVIQFQIDEKVSLHHMIFIFHIDKIFQ